MTAPDRQVAVTATWVCTPRPGVAPEHIVNLMREFPHVAISEMKDREQRPVQVSVRPASDLADADPNVGRAIDPHALADQLRQASRAAEPAPSPRETAPAALYGPAYLTEVLRRLHEADTAHTLWLADGPGDQMTTADGQTVGWTNAGSHRDYMARSAGILAHLAEVALLAGELLPADGDPDHDQAWVQALSAIEVLTPTPADGDELDDPDLGRLTPEEGQRILDTVNAHPRRDVIEAIAQASYDLDAEVVEDDAAGMWWHLSRAMALVEMLPDLRHIADATSEGSPVIVPDEPLPPPTTPAQVATGLRVVAAQLDAMPDRDEPYTSGQTSVAVRFIPATADEVDRLAVALFGEPAEPTEMGNGTWQQSTSFTGRHDRHVSGLTVTAYTGIDPPAPAESAVDGAPSVVKPIATHYETGGEVGGLGENSAECGCGTTFAGFDTHAEASAALQRHIRDESNMDGA